MRRVTAAAREAHTVVLKLGDQKPGAMRRAKKKKLNQAEMLVARAMLNAPQPIKNTSMRLRQTLIPTESSAPIVGVLKSFRA